MSTHNHTRLGRQDQDRRQRNRSNDDRRRHSDSNRRGDSDRRNDDHGRKRRCAGRTAGADRTAGVGKSAAPSHPDARAVGEHLVVDKSEWVPGRNPERQLGYDGQRGYAEAYLRCIQCGAERQSERGFPPDCPREE